MLAEELCLVRVKLQLVYVKLWLTLIRREIVIAEERLPRRYTCKALKILPMLLLFFCYQGEVVVAREMSLSLRRGCCRPPIANERLLLLRRGYRRGGRRRSFITERSLSLGEVIGTKEGSSSLRAHLQGTRIPKDGH